MASTNAESHAALQKLVSVHTDGKLPDLTSFHDFILSQPDGASNLSVLASVKPPTSSEISKEATGPIRTAGYTNQTAANGSVINLWVYQRVNLNAPGLSKSITINMGGITPGFPGGALFGTLYYDNVSDLSGGCSVAYAGVGPFFSLFFRNNGNTFATFVSGNVGWATGTAGGTGTWV